MSVELKRALYSITALADLGKEITSEKSFNEKIRSVLYVVSGTFLASKSAIFRYYPEENTLKPIVTKGFNASDLEMSRDEDPGDLRRNEAFLIGNGEFGCLAGDTGSYLVEQGIEVFVPLWARNEFVGALVLSGKFTSEDYSAEDFELLSVIATQIAIGIQNHSLFTDLAENLEKNRRLLEEMRLIYHDTIQAFAAAIDAKDVNTKNHSQRVAKYAVAIGHELDWSEEDIEGLYIAGLLHDVGKIVVHDKILTKGAVLTHEEREVIMQHPRISYDIISKIKFPWKNVLHIVKHHHERPDGNGYPDHVDGMALSEGAKILALADSFDAMTTDRPYREALNLQEAIDEIKRCLGSQFDPKIINAFCRALEKEIRGELPVPNILPHLNGDFDPSVITEILEATIRELSE